MEENFWDDRTTPDAYGKTDSERDMQDLHTSSLTSQGDDYSSKLEV